MYEIRLIKVEMNVTSSNFRKKFFMQESKYLPFTYFIPAFLCLLLLSCFYGDIKQVSVMFEQRQLLCNLY